MKVWWLTLVLFTVATSAGAAEQPVVADQPPVAAPKTVAAPAVPAAAPAEAPMAAVEPAEPIISPPPAVPATPEDAVRAALNGTSWDVQIAPLSGEGKPSKDTLSFADGQVTSANLSKAGYPSTNYSLTLREDGTASWETMQSQEGKGIVFWRGEVGGPSMRGVMSKRPAEGPTEDFGFFGQETSGKTIDILSAAMESKSVAGGSIGTVVTPMPVATPSSAPAVPAPKKKKKGLF